MTHLKSISRFLAGIAAFTLACLLFKIVLWDTPPFFEERQAEVCARRAYLRTLLPSTNPFAAERPVLVEECSPAGFKIQLGLYPAERVRNWAGGKNRWEEVLTRASLYILLPTLIIGFIFDWGFERLLLVAMKAAKQQAKGGN